MTGWVGEWTDVWVSVLVDDSPCTAQTHQNTNTLCNQSTLRSPQNKSFRPDKHVTKFELELIRPDQQLTKLELELTRLDQQLTKLELELIRHDQQLTKLELELI